MDNVINKKIDYNFLNILSRFFNIIFCLCYCVFLCGDNICAYVADVSPLIYNYYKVLYGTELRFRARNRYFKSILIDL